MYLVMCLLMLSFANNYFEKHTNYLKLKLYKCKKYEIQKRKKNGSNPGQNILKRDPKYFCSGYLFFFLYYLGPNIFFVLSKNMIIGSHIYKPRK